MERRPVEARDCELILCYRHYLAQAVSQSFFIEGEALMLNVHLDTRALWRPNGFKRLYGTKKKKGSSADVSSGPGVINITQNNFDSVLGSNEVVLISFYTEWCRFSSLMMPIFADAAEEIYKAGILPGKVALAKIDCDKEGTLATRFNISSYPTVKLFRNGFSAKSNYRGPRTVEAFVKFIKEQLTDPIVQFSHLNELHDLSEDMWHVIAYLDSRDQPEYEVFRKVAASLKDECLFHAGFGEASQKMHPPGQPTVIFRTHRKTSVEPDQLYPGPFSFNTLCTWVQEKCFPFVREITSELEEKLTAEELPFLMLLHMPCDIEGVQKFIEAIRRELISKKDKVNFLTADGIRLERMLHLLGKSSSDLPLIIFVDYCRSIYLFPYYDGMEKPGKIKQFLQDIHSSKLDKQGDFLYKTSAVVNTEKPDANEISGVADEDDISLGLFD